jgi:hypothetical protein
VNLTGGAVCLPALQSSPGQFLALDSGDIPA